MRPVFAQPLIVIDTETTGFHKQAEVIEIGAVALSRKGQILSTFSALIQPKHLDDWRTEKALLISGITKTELRQAPEPERVRVLFAQWLGAVSKATSVRPKALAYNAAFDKKLLERMGIFCEHLGIEWGECLFTWHNSLLNRRGVFLGAPKGVKRSLLCRMPADILIYLSLSMPTELSMMHCNREPSAKSLASIYSRLWEYRRTYFRALKSICSQFPNKYARMK